MPVSFTREVREELARHESSRHCCLRAQTAALLRTTGTFRIKGGSTGERYALRMETTLRSAVERVYSHLKSYGVDGNLVTRRELRLQKRLVYQIDIEGSPAALQAFNEMGILSDSFRLEQGIPGRLTKGRCCRSAFLRGCILGRGSVNAPHRETHLEIVIPHRSFAQDLVRLMEGMGVSVGRYDRRNDQVVYVKGREEVAEVLAFVGASRSALRLAEEGVVKEVRARANRLANCDEANLRRTSRAAQTQMEAIEKLERSGLLDGLPPALREVAALRRQNPYLSLRELEEEGDTGLSKSALNHRLRRLVEAADEAGD